MSRELNSLLGKTRHENFDSEACKQGRVAVNVLLVLVSVYCECNRSVNACGLH